VIKQETEKIRNREVSKGVILITILFYVLAAAPVSPFYDAIFSSLPMRSQSIFSNPAGIGVEPGSELMFNYHPDMIKTGVSFSSLGLGMIKIDSITRYEADIGIKLPGAFAFGYAYQFHDTSNHILGIICRPSQTISLGYRINLGEIKHMTGGISIWPYADYVTLSADVDYEAVEDTINYYFGGAIHTVQGSQIFFCTDWDFNWHAGLDVVLRNFTLAGAYTRAENKLSAGLIIGTQASDNMPQD